ncbi:MAG TPA: VOC family protein [Phycisphaerae bacterium]|nr:VOC family protein [Phycisphaerae bacterium]
MAGKVKPIPDGYHGALPHLTCKGAAKAIDFYKKAFGAVETMRFDAPDGTVGHAEIRIGEAVIMLADEQPKMGARSPQTLGGSPTSIYIYVPDVEAFAHRAVECGAKIVSPMTTRFYGDRSIGLEDPFGHTWGFATHVEDVPMEELKKRAAKFHGC